MRGQTNAVPNAYALNSEVVKLTGYQIVPGQKRFSQTIQTDGNLDIYREGVVRAWIDGYRDDNQSDSGITMNSFGKINPDNSAGLMVVFSEDDNKIRILLRKTINGTTTYGPVIAEL